MPVNHRFRTLLVLALTAAPGCGPSNQMSRPPGVLSLCFKPKLATVTNLTLSKAQMRLEHIFVRGDTQPPPGPGPGPAPTSADLVFNALSTADQCLTFPHLPEGLYSRVQLEFDDVTIQGTWRGAPMDAALMSFHHPMMMMMPMTKIDLYSAAGRELADGQDVTFIVDVDPATWFANNLLDAVPPNNGQIHIDQQSTPVPARDLTNNIHSSFTLE